MNRFQRFALAALAAFAPAALHAAEVAGASTTEFEATAEYDSHDAFALEVVAPLYPVAQRMRGQEGQALVEVVVREDGTTEGLALISASEPAFGRAALEAVSQWLFEPGRRHGATVRQTVVIPFDFVFEVESSDRRAVASL